MLTYSKRYHIILLIPNSIKGEIMKKININFKFITNYINENNLTIKQFCKLCDIKYYNYRQFMLCDGNIKADVLFKVCKTINIKLKDLVGF